MSALAPPDVLWHWVTPQCCTLANDPALFGKEPPEGARVHPTSDTVKRTVCATCGHAERFGTPPASGEEKAMASMKKKKTTGAPLNGGAKPTPPKSTKNGGAIGTLGEVAKVTRSEPVERRRYRLQLPCKIDLDVARDRGLELARVCRERQEFIDERKADNAAARERRAFFDERIAELRVQVEGKVETRSVDVVDRLLPTNEVQVVRLDTGEVVETRPAKPIELQESLLTHPAANAKADKGKDKKKPDTIPAPPPAVEPPFGDIGMPQPAPAHAPEVAP